MYLGTRLSCKAESSLSKEENALFCTRGSLDLEPFQASEFSNLNAQSQTQALSTFSPS